MMRKLKRSNETGWEETTRKAPLPDLHLGEELTCTGYSPTLLIIHVIHPLTM